MKKLSAQIENKETVKISALIADMDKWKNFKSRRELQISKYILNMRRHKMVMLIAKKVYLDKFVRLVSKKVQDAIIARMKH